MFATKSALKVLSTKLSEESYWRQSSKEELFRQINDLGLKYARLEDKYLMLLDHLNLEVVYPEKNPKPYLKDVHIE